MSNVGVYSCKIVVMFYLVSVRTLALPAMFMLCNWCMHKITKTTTPPGGTCSVGFLSIENHIGWVLNLRRQ